MNFIPEIPLILFIGIALVALFFSAILYLRANNDFSKVQKGVLITLRGLAIIFISFLIFSPFWNRKQKITQKPILVVGVDNSSSSLNGSDSALIRETMPKTLMDLHEGLSVKYDVHFMQFGEKVEPVDEIDFKDQVSDYGAFISQIESRFHRQNIGALLMLGDGNFNRGIHPLNKIRATQIPAYSLVLGDTVAQPDQAVASIRVNPSSFLNSKFPVEVGGVITNFQGHKSELRISQKGKIIARKELNVLSDEFFLQEQFYIEANSVGIQEYEVELVPLEGEINLKNNKRIFVVNVLEDKYKILVLTSAPHPDIGALRNALKKESGFEMIVKNIDDFKGKTSDYQLVVLFQLPRLESAQSKVWKQLATSRTPYFLVGGTRTNWNQVNVLNLGMKVTSVTGLTDMSEPHLNYLFGLFQTDPGLDEVLPSWPPLNVPFIDFELEKSLRVLLYQRINGIETEKPLLVVGKVGNKKAGILLGEGIWQWRMNEYHRFESHKNFDAFFTRIIKYMAIRPNEDDFIIHHEMSYESHKNVEFQAEVYDDNFKFISNADISMTIIGENDLTFDYSFDKEGLNYSLDMGIIPAGKYRFEARAKVGEEMRTEKGEFMVREVDAEKLTSVANRRWMFQAAAQTGGKVFPFSEAEKLKEALLKNERAKKKTVVVSLNSRLIDFKFIWVLIALCMAAEWFLRKFWGSY